ncbi:MAG: T9SS type A sorting domain-containing protein [Candidatus Krumholzibacteriota bacterium]|nr:T9SS type A sorting domain-containing protein [Candidatus Krumholzibacteriota bacterium]
MRGRSRQPVLFGLLILFCFSLSIQAAWEEDGTLVEPAPESPVEVIFRDLRMADNGMCGIGLGWFIAGSSKYYYQGLNWEGSLLWPSDPVSWILPGGYLAGIPRIASDNTGGMYLTSSGSTPDLRHAFITARLYAAADTVTDIDFFDGYLGEKSLLYPSIVSDGYTGAIVCWGEYPEILPSYGIIKAQRIMNDNTVLWETNGTVLCNMAGTRYSPVAAADGSGGAIIVWIDCRDPGREIYAQRIDFAGVTKWTTNGIPVCAAGGEPSNYDIFAQPPGGAIATWVDQRNGGKDIYIQHLASDGSLLWAAEGAPVCLAPGTQDYPFAVTDGIGGALVIWKDFRSGDSDIYAQRISSLGEALWAENGVPVACGPGDQRCPRICSSGDGGAIIAWVDDSTGESDIYCQAVDSDGSFCWGPGFVPVCTAAGDQDEVVIQKHCLGGAFIAWVDFRSSSYGEIRATHILPTTTDADTPVMGEELILGQNYPNPFNPATTISFDMKKAAGITLKIYDPAGRLVRTLVDEYRGSGSYNEIWDGLSDTGMKVSSGTYFYQVTSGTEKRSRKMVLLR